MYIYIYISIYITEDLRPGVFGPDPVTDEGTAPLDGGTRPETDDLRINTELDLLANQHFLHKWTSDESSRREN